MRATSSAALRDSLTPSVVRSAAVATPVMFSAICVEPVAASLMLRLISLVVEVCSSTAEAIIVEYPLIFSMTSTICRIASTAASASDWIFCTRAEMSPVACAVS